MNGSMGRKGHRETVGSGCWAGYQRVLRRIARRFQPCRRMILSRGDDDVVAFAFAEEEVFAEEKVGGGDGSLKVCFADVVDVNAAAIDVLAGLSFGRGEACVNEKFHEGSAGAVELALLKVFGWDFAGDVVEGGFGNAFESAAEQDFAGADGFGGGVVAVDEVGDFLRQRFVGLARAGVGGVLLFEGFNAVAPEEGEEFEVTDDVAIVGADPELVEAVDAGFFGIEPDGAGDGFAEFGAVGVGDEGEGEAVDGCAEFFSAEVDAGGDVAPLIAATDLEFAVEFLAEVIEIECLEEHVAEFGVADAGFAVFHAGADAFLGDHHVDGKMLADVAQEFEVTDGSGPGGVVEEAGGIDLGVEVQEAAELFLDGGDVGVEDFAGEQLAFGGLAAGIADGTGGAAGNGDGIMAEQLESPEREERNEVADVQAVGGGIESAVDRGRGGNETFDEFLAVGAIRQQSAPFDFRVDVHQHQSYRVWT